MSDEKKGLDYWRARLTRDAPVFEASYSFKQWERYYRGEYELDPITANDREDNERPRKARHIRRIIAENIEATIDSAIPQPKVQARRPEDEELARLIEDMIRNEIDRLPMEELNDLMERVVPINGGGAWLVEWDDEAELGRGAISVQALHPSRLCPQNGVFTSIEDMDYIILNIPQTKSYVKTRYGKDVRDESDDETRADKTQPDDVITIHRAYYREENGVIGLFAWVNDIVLDDLPNYQARRERVCARCGTPEGDAITAPTIDGTRSDKLICPLCGASKWTEREMTEEPVTTEITLSDGSVVPPFRTSVTAEGISVFEQTTIPTYTPSVYPIVLQKNISVHGQLLGESDVEKVRDQQNLISRLDLKITDKLVKSGSTIILPPEASIRIDSTDGRILHLENAMSADMIKNVDFEGNIAQDMAYLTEQYEAARKILGITDSFQGRRDSTAQSGVAKQFAAAQSAGRLESRRAMKRAAWSHIFELIFKFRLAYTDEDFHVQAQDENGDPTYKLFSRYLFLRADGAGGYEWNDDFLFSCDADAALANNREARWQDMFNFYNAGTFGNPQDPFSQLLFWQEMRELHYPGAERMVKALRERMEQLQQQQQAQAMADNSYQITDNRYGGGDGNAGNNAAAGGGVPPEIAARVEEAARRDAARDAGMSVR